MKNLTTLVLGASLNSHRYSNKAILDLVERGYRVVAIGKAIGFVNGVQILEEIPKNIIEIDTVTIYLNPKKIHEILTDLKLIVSMILIYLY